MLRITVHDNPRDLTFQLEGSLAGPCLRVLEECCQDTSPDEPAWQAVSLVAVLALATTVSTTWYLSRARAERRWRAAWDRYAEQE